MAMIRKKIAIVVQRAGEDIVGGSEGYALSMARILSDSFHVDILSTTAKDHVTWRNAYPAGVCRVSDALRIIRFGVKFEREQYWFELDRIMTKDITLDVFEAMPARDRATFIDYKRRLPLGLGEEWIKYEGPYSPDLLDYISAHSDSYEYFIFMTYLYPTTFFGIDRVKDPDKVYFVPTYHDESPAYLPNFLKYKKYRHLFLTNAERNIAAKNLYGAQVRNSIIGFGIQDRLDQIGSAPKADGEKYVLYAGRIEAAKGVQQMFKLFEQYSAENKDLKLYLIGDGILKDYPHRNIVYKGFVSEDEKLRLMRDAIAFIHPSAFESLGIVLLESFMMGTPALVNRKSDVLHEHIQNSGAGYSYDNYEEFRDGLNRLLDDKLTSHVLSKRARDYFLLNYSLKAYKERLFHIFDTGNSPWNLLMKIVQSAARLLRLFPRRRRHPLGVPEDIVGTGYTGPAQAETGDKSGISCPSLTVPAHEPAEAGNKNGIYCHDLTLPAHETEESIYNYLSQFHVEFAPKQEMDTYLKSDFRRFLYTLSLIPAGTGKLFEIGANPYYMSMLIRKYTGYELSCSNYFAEGLAPESSQNMMNDKDEKIEFKFHHFNVEVQAIPFPEQHFDVVLFCEVIEHMTKDPMNALLNVKKALKPDGYLILTTPNVSRLENVAKMMAGNNIYDPYSGHGTYGRHNREYSKHELHLLLTHLGFEIETMFSSDVHENASDVYFKTENIKQLLEFRKPDLGQYIFIRAKNVRDANSRKPSWLYRSYKPDDLCD